jgi:hypothetical protein
VTWRTHCSPRQPPCSMANLVFFQTSMREPHFVHRGGLPSNVSRTTLSSRSIWASALHSKHMSAARAVSWRSNRMPVRRSFSVTSGFYAWTSRSADSVPHSPWGGAVAGCPIAFRRPETCRVGPHP